MIATLDALYDRYEITEPERRRIEILSQEVYENTPCGVSVSLSEDGAAVLLSTIVEGSDAEWSMILEFPIEETEWDGALEAAEAWSDTVRDELGDETYTLSDAERQELVTAINLALNSAALNGRRFAALEGIEIMFTTASAITVTYPGPEGK